MDVDAAYAGSVAFEVDKVEVFATGRGHALLFVVLCGIELGSRASCGECGVGVVWTLPLFEVVVGGGGGRLGWAE